MSAGQPGTPSPGTASQYSKQKAVRWGLYGAGVAGAALLVVAEFSTVISVRVAAVVREEQTGLDRHAAALALLGLVALAMLAVAWHRGSRPAMVALAGMGLAAAVIALALDLPDLDQVGSFGDSLRPASAQVGAGFYLEGLGAVLLICCGGGLLLADPAPPSAQRPAAAGRDRRQAT